MSFYYESPPILNQGHLTPGNHHRTRIDHSTYRNSIYSIPSILNRTVNTQSANSTSLYPHPHHHLNVSSSIYNQPQRYYHHQQYYNNNYNYHLYPNYQPYQLQYPPHHHPKQCCNNVNHRNHYHNFNQHQYNYNESPMDVNNLEINCVEVEINDSSNETQIYSVETDDGQDVNPSPPSSSSSSSNQNVSVDDQHQAGYSKNSSFNRHFDQQHQQQQPQPQPQRQPNHQQYNKDTYLYPDFNFRQQLQQSATYNDGNYRNDICDISATINHNQREYNSSNAENDQSTVNLSQNENDSDGIPEEILDIIESLEAERQTINATYFKSPSPNILTVNTQHSDKINNQEEDDDDDDDDKKLKIIELNHQNDCPEVIIDSYQENDHDSNLENNLTFVNCNQNQQSTSINIGKSHQEDKNETMGNIQSKGYQAQESILAAQSILANTLNKTDKSESNCQPNYPCDYPGCDRLFNLKAGLRLHRKDHTGDKSIECAICRGIFDRFDSYSRHMRYVHNIAKNGKRYHLCEYPECNKVFTSITRLTAHKQTHEDAESRRYISLLSKEDSNIGKLD